MDQHVYERAQPAARPAPPFLRQIVRKVSSKGRLQKLHTTIIRANRAPTKYANNTHETISAAPPTHIITRGTVGVSNSRALACRIISNNVCGMSLLGMPVAWARRHWEDLWKPLEISKATATRSRAEPLWHGVPGRKLPRIGNSSLARGTYRGPVTGNTSR
jgi:hypothetical protein